MTIRSSQSHSRAGFTMVEVMITIGIIITLASLAVYGIAAAKRAARRAETVARLNAISTALTQYHSDFGTYPPSFSAGYDGSQMLSESMLGWQNNDGAGTTHGDSTDFGFRVIAGRGKVYGPYLPPDPKTFYSDTGTYANGNVFIDANGNSILYYKAVPQKIGRATRTINAVFSDSAPPPANQEDAPGYANFTAFRAIYQTKDNQYYWVREGSTVVKKTFGAANSCSFPDNAADDQKAFRKLLGDLNGDNAITTGELINGSDSYLLVAPGEDGLYFTADDVISGSK